LVAYIARILNGYYFDSYLVFRQYRCYLYCNQLYLPWEHEIYWDWLPYRAWQVGWWWA